MVQHVAGATEVSEPLAAGLCQALELTGPGAGGGTVVSQDIVLSQLTGSLLQVTQSSDQSVAGPPYREV